MLETICRDCGERYPLGQEHRCKSAKKLERVAKAPKQAESDDNSQPVTRSNAPKRGRPRIHEDRKAYKALKAKEYRARKKAK